MSKILEAIDLFAASSKNDDWKHPAVRAYIRTGDREQLLATRISPGYDAPLGRCLAEASSWDAESEHLLRLAIHHQREGIYLEWFDRHREGESVDWTVFTQAVNILMDCSGGDEALVRSVLRYFPLWDAANGRPTPAGELLLKAGDSDLSSKYTGHFGDLARLLACGAVGRVESIMALLPEHARPQLWTALVTYNAQMFHERAAGFVRSHEKPWECLRLIAALSKVPGSPHRDLVIPTALAALDSCEQLAPRVEACEILISVSATEALPRTLALLSSNQLPWNASAMHAPSLADGRFLQQALAAFPDQALAIFENASRSTFSELVQTALKAWNAHPQAKQDLSYFSALVRLLGSVSTPVVQLAVHLAVEHNRAATQEHLWNLIGHTDEKVSALAARTLATYGEASLPRIVEIFSSAESRLRLAAIAVLESVPTDAAVAMLWQQWEIETEDAVIDRLLIALERRLGQVRLTAEQLKQRMVQTLPRVAAKPTPWMDPKLMQVFKKDGTLFPADELSYLLHRQSHCQEMRADIEAAPLYEQVDRQRNGAAAVAAVEGFLKSKQKIVDRWVLAWAALTGNDALVPVLLEAIKRWVDIHRNRHAECAAVALKLLKTDTALSALDLVSLRYRAKKPNVALAAAEAFTSIAEERGVSPEKLGDQLVPNLGFDEHGVQIITGTKTSYEARMSTEGKLVFKDVKSGKVSSGTPSGLSAEGKNAVKELAKNIKETLKAQAERLESLMVKQARWSAPEWMVLYPAHPLLRPLSSRIIWGVQGPDHEWQTTFRLLEDGALCDVSDDEIRIDKTALIGIVHPLQLTSAQLEKWIQHLVDYNVAQPFQQAGRTFVTVSNDEREKRMSGRFAQVTLGALTFRDRAMRAGWRRASVGDGGMIGHFVKRMPALGVDAWLEAEGLYFGSGPDDQVQVGRLFFMSSTACPDSVGSYGLPHAEEDGRLMPFASVPQIAYSEAIADLIKITGQNPGPNEDETHE